MAGSLQVWAKTLVTTDTNWRSSFTSVVIRLCFFWNWRSWVLLPVIYSGSFTAFSLGVANTTKLFPCQYCCLCPPQSVRIHLNVRGKRGIWGCSRDGEGTQSQLKVTLLQEMPRFIWEKPRWVSESLGWRRSKTIGISAVTVVILILFLWGMIQD